MVSGGTMLQITKQMKQMKQMRLTDFGCLTTNHMFVRLCDHIKERTTLAIVFVERYVHRFSS